MSPARVAVVLYEDALRKERFEPHRFVCSCVNDQTQQGLGAIDASLEARPMKGVDAVLKTIRRGDRVIRQGEHLIALVDGDRIRRHLQISGDLPREHVESRLRGEAPVGVRFRAFVLERNLESVLAAVETCFAAQVTIRDYALRAKDKDRLSRDLAFKGAATSRFADERRCVLSRVPSFAEFVSYLTKLCGSPRNDRPPVEQ